MRIGIDLDGVCYDFTGNLRKWCVDSGRYTIDQLQGGGHDDPDSSWNFFKDCWNWTTKEFLTNCDDAVNDGYLFRHGEPFPGTKNAFSAIHEHGHSIHIVTNRSFGDLSPQNTIEWLHEHDLPYDSITFAADKTVVNLDLMIDDYEKNFIDMTNHGVRVYLQDRPWNRHVETSLRVHTWDDFLAEVLLADEHGF